MNAGGAISLMKIYVYKYCSLVYIFCHCSQLGIKQNARKVARFLASCLRAEFDRPSSDQAPTKLSSPEQESLRELTEALGSDTLSATQLMERMGLVHQPHFRQFYLVPALEKGIIERTIADRPNSPRQRYRVKKQGD